MLAVWKKSPSVFEPNYFRSVLQKNGVERSLDEVRSIYTVELKCTNLACETLYFFASR